MSSYSEYMESKYGKRPKKEEEEKKENKVDGSSVWDSSYESLHKQLSAKYGSAIDSEGVKSWFTESESTIKSLSDYYKANEGKWVSNYGGYFTDSITKLKSTAADVAYYLRNHKSEFSDYDTLSKALSDYRSYLEEAEKHNTTLRDFYSNWQSEDEYNAWYGYQKNFENIDANKAAQGWSKYLADEEAAKNVLKHDLNSDGKESWWEKGLGYLAGDGGGVVDTTLPNAEVTQTIHDLRADESYRRPNDDWTQEQKDAFGQLYAVNPNLAFDFAEETNKRNNNKKEEDALKAIAESATSGFWAGAGHTLGAIASAQFGLADYLSDLAMGNAGRDIAPDGNVSPFEYSQAVTSGITEHLNTQYGTFDEDLWLIGGKGWGDAYGLGKSIAQSMVSAYTLGSAGTLISYFGQGAASGVDDALSRGATEGQAVLYGTALGVFEGVAEKVGIDNLFKLGSAATLKGFFKNVLKQAGAEGMEEGLTSLLTNIADNVIMQDKSNFNSLVAQYMAQGMSESEAKKKAWWDSVEGIAYDTITGAISGGVSGGIHTTAQSRAENKTIKNHGQAIIDKGGVDSLKQLALEMSGASKETTKLANKVGQNASAKNVGKLSMQLEQTITEQNRADMESALIEKGLTKKEARLAAEYIVGGELTAEQESQIEHSDHFQKAIDAVLEDSNTNVSTNSLKLHEARHGKSITTPTDSSLVAEAKPSVTKNITSKEIATESDFEVSEDGKTKIGDTEVTIKEIASIKDGVLTLRLEDGSTVNASDVEYSSSEEGLLYENVVHMGLNATTANAFINGYEGNMPVAEYALDFRQAYRYGELGIPKSEMNSERFVSRLSASVKDLAYNLGSIDAKYKASEKQSSKAKIESTDAIKSTNNASKGKTKGKLHNTLKPTNETQRASLKALGVVAEALNIDIYTFESPLVNGRRQGANGWYDAKDNSLYLDLFAGDDGKGTMLFTAAHELTHHIREKLPAKFKAFADFLFEQYGENGVAVSELIARKIDHLEKNGRTEGLTESQIYDLAYEEVVADACESFLADGDAVAKIAELKAKDKTLWQTIKDFLTKLVARIKAAYEGLSPDSVEGKLVADMLDTAEKLKAMWVEMVVEASEVTDLVEVDMDTESVAPMFSERTWTASEYVTEREETAKKISEALGVNLKTAYKYIDDINGVARLIADDRARLDYEPNLDEKATVLKPNSEYKFSVDMSTLCAKRLLFTGTFDAIQKALPNMVFESEDIVSLREMMQKRGYEVACGICYVESTRREIGRITQEFIDRYKVAQQTGKPISRINSSGKEVILKSAGRTFSADKNYTPNLGELNTTDIDIVKRDHREVYDAYLAFMNARGQAKPKLLETRAEYKGEILTHFKAKSSVEARNNAGGLRLQSFSDFEVPHMIDMMQIVMDMSRVGLKSQAYTKVPAFAEIFGATGVKINLSLIAKGDGLDANGNLIFDDVEGINHKEAFKLRDQYSKNVGTILVGKTDAHIIAAMADSRIDYIIPFHKSSWKESLYDALGLTGYADYTDFQNEKPIDKDRKIKNFDPSEYWDFTKTGDENAQIYLKKCREDGRIPKFPQFQGYPGYWKLLIDFKMYDNNGVGSPQEVVKPVFNTEASERILGEYKGGHKSFPVAKDVVEDFVKEHKDEVKYSDRDSLGNELSKEQQEYFKDSKVRDKKGNLLVVYHGTTANFNTFKKGDVGFHFGTKGAARGRVGFGKNVILKEVYLNITHPIVFDEDLGSWDADYRLTRELYDMGILTQADAESILFTDNKMYRRTTEAANKKLASVLFEKGYDGIAYSNTFETKKPTISYIVFNSNQAKEITNKAPTPNSDIRYSDRYQSADTNSDILTMVKKVADGNFRANEKVYLGTVSDPTATEIHKITGIDVKGFKVAIEARQIEHILKDHGKNGTTDRSMANPSDIAKIEYAIENYDDIRRAGKTRAYKHIINGATTWVDTVLYEKEIGEKSYYVVQAVPDTKAKTLYIVTAFIGKQGYKKEASQFIDVKNPDATPKSEIVNTSNGSIPQSPNSVKREFSDAEEKLSSYRDTDSVSNRSLLANALESVAQNDIERNKLKEYKSKIALIESEQEKLADIRAEIKELSFAKGRRDTEALKKLQFEANQAANRINTYDRQLLNLESTKALKGVLEREKQMAYKKAMKEGKEALVRQKEKAAKTQRELLTRYQESRKKGIEGRHKTEMRYKIKSVVSELNQYLTKGTKEKHVPIELQKAVAEALNAVNMDTVGAEERIAKKRAEMMVAKSPEVVEKLAKEIGHIEEMGGNMAKKIARLKTAYDSIINSDDPLIANSHDDVITNTIDRVLEVVGETPLRDMSLYQLEAVYDMYRMVLTSVRNANKAFKAQKSEEISVIANRVMEEIDSLGKKKLYRNKAEQFASKFDWNNLKPVYAFERIGSDTFTEVFNNVRAGEDTWAVDITEAKEFSTEQHKKYKYDSWDFKKRYRFTSTSGMSFELSLDQIMSLYAYSKREQAKDHLKRGGIVFDETTEVTIKTKLGIPVKYNPTQATAYNLSEETLADIISKLTTEQREFVDVMQDYLSSTMGDKGNEVSLALYGVKLYKEKNYFPLKSATQFMAKAKEQQKGEVKIKNSGFSKETKPKASNPIVLTPFMDVWADHVNEMSMYHAFVLALEDFYRVFNYKTPTSDTMATESVEMYLQNAFGKAATQYIDQLLKDLNGGARVDSTVGVINKLTGLFKKSAVFASASVVVQQPSAIARATALVDTKYFVGKPSKHKETWAEVKKYAPVAIIKEMGYFDTGMGQSTVEWLKGQKTLGDKVDDVASKAPALADEYAWCAIWNAVKRETLHTQKNLHPNSEEFLKVVGERFTEVIVKTQVYDSVLARSANMRSKDTGMKMATAFMGEPTTSLNMLENALVQGKRGNKKYAVKAVGSVVSAMILNSVLVSIVYAGRDDDEDKTYVEKYISTLTEELLDSLNPLTLIPFVKDIVSIAQGYDVERSDMAVITDIMNAWNNLGNDNRSAYRKVEDFAGAIAAILGLPIKNVMRDARAMYNTVNSFINGEKTTGAGIKDAVTEAITGDAKSNGQQLYEAMVRGDTAQIERVKGRFEDQNAINSAIRKALRENDPRIKEAAEASINGDTTAYSRIFNEILSEGHFELADIKAAIKSEIGEFEPDDDSTLEDIDKAESMFELEHYYTALISGDLGTATNVKNDLIDTAVANGKTREDAEDSFKTSFRSYVGKMYKGGEISRSAASNMLVKYGGYDADEAENEVYWKLKEWDFKIANGENASYSKYTDFYEAVKTGRNLKAVISEYTSHGVEAKTLATQITSYYKPLYKAMTNAERANIKGYLLNAYALLGYDRTKKARDIDKWLED